jgi:hypothetical protein
VPSVGIADRDDERDCCQDRAADRAPPRVVDDFQEEEVRQQEDEEAGVAVEDTDEIGSEPHVAWTTTSRAVRLVIRFERFVAG